MKIIVYTGSFNPLTKGHVLTMESAINAIDADKGMFVMTPGKYLNRKMYIKNKSSFVLSEDTREQMITSICNDNNKFQFGGKELGSSSPSTVKTLNSMFRMKSTNYKECSKYADVECKYSMKEDSIFEKYKDRIIAYNGSTLITDYKQMFTVQK